MKGLKKYFSPPQVDVKAIKSNEEAKDESDKTKIVKNNDHAKEISDDLIVKNMEEVLKSIKRKRKKEKHKKKHHKDKKRERKEEPEVIDTEEPKTEISVPDSNKENVKKQPFTMNAFQLMMNARKNSIGSNSNGVESPEGTNSGGGTNVNKRKRKEMLQEWADVKGGRSRKETEDAGERYAKRELQKRATRLKNLLTNGSKTDQDDDEIEIDSDDVDFDPKMKFKIEKKRTKRRRISFHDDDDSQKRTPNGNDFTSKLRSPLKKRDSLLGYFSKVQRNDESPVSPVSDVIVSDKKSKRGRPRREEMTPVTPPVPKQSPKEIETPDTTHRPRRSCTLVPKSYKFESPPSDKKKQEAPKVPLVIEISEDSSETTPPASKLASIFQKKPKGLPLDPVLVKARQDFLRSGLPEAMRQEIDRQKELEESFLNEIPHFPVISHVTQGVLELHSPIRTKIRPEIPETELETYQNLSAGTFTDTKERSEARPELSWSHVKDRKAAGRKLKLVFEKFPTYKCFHQLHEKQKTSQESSTSGELFTERYKPTSSDQFLINSGPVTSLKKFLSGWKDAKNGIYDSCDDFEDSSRDSRSSSVIGSNAMLIYGPCGSGKTSSVLALADEMHFNVLEINAGSKRTGKNMLRQLQEATQSHQLRKGKEKLLKRQDSSQSDSNKKISLILIEDADVIFEQDDGFVSGVTQLVAISKRPVILTAIDPSLPHLVSYLNQNSIEFRPPSPTTAAKYLTVMCLAENYLVSDHEIRKLYEKNDGDLRKTILQLQLYVQTGGDLKIAPTDEYKNDQNDELIEVIPVTEDDLNEHDDETLKFSTASTDDRVVGAPIEHIHTQFRSFFDGTEKKSSNSLKQTTSLEEICIRSEFISSVCELQMMPKEIPDRLTHDLNEEIFDWLCNENEICLKGPEKSERPKLHESLPNSNLMSQHERHLDYEPILREICRTEKQRLSKERKGSRFYHYLRNLNPTSFSKDYFDQFTEILQN